MGKKKLLEAVKAGDDAKVQKIVTKGKFNVDVCDEAGYSSLTHAAMLGYCKILRYLMQANVDMNKPDAQNRTALYVGMLTQFYTPCSIHHCKIDVREGIAKR